MDICNKKLKGVFIITVLIILCLSVASVSMFYMPNNTANAITNIPSQSTNLGEMLLDGYEDDATGKVFNGEVFWQLISQISGEGIADNNTISSLTTTKTSADFRSQNDGQDIVVTIGEKQWIATYLSTNYSGDPILTLWLANSSTKARWNEKYANSLGKYPSNMYGTSEIRAKTLNNGGGYAANYSDTELTLLAQDSENEWAIYTMDKIDADGNTVLKGSIKEFIEVPNNISWQHEQKAKDYLISSAYTNLCNYNNNNDALDMGGNGAKGDYSNKSPIDQAGYGSWAQDRLWLPSIAETGVSAVEGIWETTTSTRANSENTWLRSADYNSYACAYRLTSAGTGLNYNVSGMYVTNSYSVRPAFHLNLAKVAESATAATPNTKGETKKYYNETGGVADEITFELEKVNSSLTDIVIEATDIDGNSITSPTYKIEEGILTFKVSQVGKYVVKVTPKTDECWSDGSNGTKEYTYYLKYHVTPMRFAGDVSNLVYKGSKQYLAVENYKEEYMNISPSSGVEFERIPDGENAGEWGISATNAGEGYKVTVALKNTEYMEWTDNNLSTPKSDLTFNISKKALNVNVGSLWSTEVYTGKEYELELDCAEEDIGKLRFEGYYKGGSITTETKVDVQPVMSGREKKVIIKLPKLSEKGEYKYILRLAEGIAANGNYTINCENTFSVGNKRIDLSESEIVWRYANASIENGAYKNVGELDASGAFNVEYNGSAYSFEENVLELREDIRDSIEYEYVGERSGVEVKVSRNIVENYTVTFKIKARNGNTSIDIVTSEFTLKWRVNKALLDLSNVKWGYTSPLKYTDKYQEVKMEGIPNGLTFNYNNNRKMEVGEYSASVISITLAENMKNNYIRPEIGKAETYKGDVEWTLEWKIEKGELELDWERKAEEDSNGKRYWSWEVSNTDKVEYAYYTEEGYANGAMSGEELRKEDILVPEGREEKDYWVVARLKEGYSEKYEIRGTQAMPFKVGSSAPIIEIGMEKEFVYDGSKHGGEWYKAGAPGMEYIRGEYYEIGEDGSKTKLTEEPTDAGRYEVRLEIEEEYAESYQLSEYKIEYEIVKAKIKAEWESKGEKPELKGLSEAEKEKIEYEYRDEKGNVVAESELENGKTYKVIAKIKSEYRGNYEFVDLEGNVLTEPSESGEYEFKYDDGSEEPGNPDDPNTPIDPDDPNNPINPDDPNKPDEPTQTVDFDKVLDILKEWWQVIASGVSIALIIIFTAKGIGYASKKKENRKTVESKYKTYYVTGGTGLFGLSMTNWTIIAGVLMGVAVLSLVFMLIEKKGYKKSVKELEDAKEEYARNREEMMFMRMNGNGNMQGQNYGYSAQPAVGIEDMRCMINDAVSAMLPNVQQYLPQQASANDELVQKLIEQNEQNEERIRQLTEENKETINRMSERNDERIERFLQKLSEQKVAEKEVVATVANEEMLKELKETIREEIQSQMKAGAVEEEEQKESEETIKELSKSMAELREIVEEITRSEKREKEEKAGKEKVVERIVEVEKKEDRIEALIKTNERLMEKIIELSSSKGNDKPIIVQQPAPQIVEKIVEKPVEKVVEKEVRVEVPVEKIVEKTVPLPVEKPTAKAKTVAPRLTLDEAYAKLSKQQKKFFDTLKEYAMSKDKCKEKKSTYYILLGQSSVNPLVKLTIKKDSTVALFKMEDEYMKDIRRNAGSEGTKVKVKETELIVGDSQALATAKEMIDLREDQIERYNEYIKEQRSMRKS